MHANLVLDARAHLGEGPVWDEKRGVLWWVNIMAGELHCFNPTTGEDNVYEVGQPLGFAVLRKSGGLILGLQGGFAEFYPESNTLSLLHDPEADLPDNRFNDGKCDPAGRFIAGTMPVTESDHYTGSLYRYDADATCKRLFDNVGISNGLTWSADGSTFYYIDSLLRNVRAFDYDLATGDLSNERIVIDVPPEAGLPDGMTIDNEGMLWIAHYGGWAVRRWNPETGEELAKIELPCANVTCCTFGGEALDTLYITTAAQGLSEEALAEQPLAGGIFSANVGYSGQLPYQFVG